MAERIKYRFSVAFEIVVEAPQATRIETVRSRVIDAVEGCIDIDLEDKIATVRPIGALRLVDVPNTPTVEVLG